MKRADNDRGHLLLREETRHLFQRHRIFDVGVDTTVQLFCSPCNLRETGGCPLTGGAGGNFLVGEFSDVRVIAKSGIMGCDENSIRGGAYIDFPHMSTQSSRQFKTVEGISRCVGARAAVGDRVWDTRIEIF